MFASTRKAMAEAVRNANREADKASTPPEPKRKRRPRKKAETK